MEKIDYEIMTTIWGKGFRFPRLWDGSPRWVPQWVEKDPLAFGAANPKQDTWMKKTKAKGRSGS